LLSTLLCHDTMLFSVTKGELPCMRLPREARRVKKEKGKNQKAKKKIPQSDRQDGR